MAESKIGQCAKIFRLNPNPTEKQIEQVMIDVDCSRRTAYRALAEVRKANKMALMRKGAKGKKKQSKKKTSKKKKKKSTKGRKKTNLKNIHTPPSFQPPPPKLIAPIPPDMTFEYFCKWHAQPGYDGMYRWQKQWDKEVWPQKFSVTKVPRDHGKTVVLGNKSQWAMSAQDYDVLYLGWTGQRIVVAKQIYKFFMIRQELISDKTTSQSHFNTTYGTKFDTYSVKSKEILGMHPVGDLTREIIDENRYLEDYMRNSEKKLLLIIDDPIDGTFRKERHKGKTLEDFFLSTIISINPDKLMVVGTHKYEGDFLHFVKREVYKEEMFEFIRTPYLAKTNPRYGKETNNPSNLLCPERWIDDTHPQYGLYLELIKIVREGNDPRDFTLDEQELFKKEDLTKKKDQMKAYWWGAEYMQDPHPVTGEVWDDIAYERNFKGTAAYDLCVISIDRATTQHHKSDFTGITVFFRERKTGIKLVTRDYTKKIRITDLIAFIEEIYKDFRVKYRYNIKIIIVVEKQGGGDDFCDLAEDSGASFSHALIRVHNTRNKIERIEDNLGTPIQTHEVRFLDALETSELIIEINSFPYCNKIDALDSLSNGYFEAEKIPQLKMDADKLISMLQQHKDTTKNEQDWRTLLQQNTNNRRSIFR